MGLIVGTKVEIVWRMAERILVRLIRYAKKSEMALWNAYRSEEDAGCSSSACKTGCLSDLLSFDIEEIFIIESTDYPKFSVQSNKIIPSGVTTATSVKKLLDDIILIH